MFCDLKIEAFEKLNAESPIKYERLKIAFDYHHNLLDLIEYNIEEVKKSTGSEKKELTFRTLELNRERKGVEREINSILKEMKFKYSDFEVIDEATEIVESPVAEVSMLLTENFEVCNAFGNVNSTVIANIIGRKLSTKQMHKAVLDNFNGVRFRKQNGGYTYTLRHRNTLNLND